MRIEDVIFGEVENACAYCGQHGRENLTVHHIDGKKNNNEYDNQIVLCHNCHHRLTSNKGISHADIVILKTVLIMKTLTQYGINAIKICYRRDSGILAHPYLVYHLVDLGYMDEKETQMFYGSGKEEIKATVRFVITEKGKQLYENWLKS
jgi:hypothetical protein